MAGKSKGNRFKIGDVLHTNTYGDIEIVNSYIDTQTEFKSVAEKTNKSHLYDVKFLNNGNIVKSVKQRNILRGRVANPTNGFIKDKIFQSNTSGPFIMLEHLGTINSYARVRVKFLNTNTIIDVDLKNALEGRIKDPNLTKRSDDFDIARFDDYDSYIEFRLKATYFNMMARCYNKNFSGYNNYGAKGITVCESWRNNINNFLRDAKLLKNYDKFYERPYLYHLDKDKILLSIGLPIQRKYCKELCQWLHEAENSQLAGLFKYDPKILEEYLKTENRRRSELSKISLNILMYQLKK